MTSRRRRRSEKLESIAGERFKWASASLGADGLFASAYHIKAAVWSRIARGRPAEDRVVSISSGNWQSSNQAPIDTEVADIGSLTWDEVASYNREWHALVAHKGLAADLPPSPRAGLRGQCGGGRARSANAAPCRMCSSLKQ